jgi:hypothetical protein
MRLKNQWLRAALVGVAALAVPCPSRAEEPVLLGWRFRKGEVLSYRVLQEQQQTTSGLRDSRARQALAIRLRAEVKDVESSGAATISIAYPSVSIDSEDSRRGRYTYDSNAAADRARPDAPPQSALLDTTVTCRIDAAGRTTDAAATHTGRAAETPELALAFGSDAMQRQLETWLRVAPGRPAKPGETWSTTSESEVPSLGVLRVESVFTLEGLEPLGPTPCARISRVSSITVTAAPSADARIPAKITLRNGGAKGRVFFDAARGRLQQSVTELTLDMDIELSAPSPGEPPALIRQHLEQKVTLDLIGATPPE